jgi:hypothetical protein
MKLRHKTLLLTTLPLLGLMAILYGSFSVILQRSYSRLEQQDAQRNLKRVDGVLAGDLRPTSEPYRRLGRLERHLRFSSKMATPTISSRISASTPLKG